MYILSPTSGLPICLISFGSFFSFVSSQFSSRIISIIPILHSCAQKFVFTRSYSAKTPVFTFKITFYFAIVSQHVRFFCGFMGSFPKTFRQKKTQKNCCIRFTVITAVFLCLIILQMLLLFCRCLLHRVHIYEAVLMPVRIHRIRH